MNAVEFFKHVQILVDSDYKAEIELLNKLVEYLSFQKEVIVSGLKSSTDRDCDIGVIDFLDTQIKKFNSILYRGKN